MRKQRDRVLEDLRRLSTAGRRARGVPQEVLVLLMVVVAAFLGLFLVYKVVSVRVS